MKALTVWRPSAALIVDGRKPIENRSTNWSYRGPVAIHAGLRWDRSYRIRETARRLRSEPPGAIIGLVELVGIHADTGCCRRRYGRAGTLHLELADPRRCPPVYCTGRQGLWTVPAELEELIAA